MPAPSAPTAPPDQTRLGRLVQTLCVDWGRDAPGTPIVEIRHDDPTDQTTLLYYVVLLSPTDGDQRAVIATTASLGMAVAAALQAAADLTGRPEDFPLLKASSTGCPTCSTW